MNGAVFEVIFGMWSYSGLKPASIGDYELVPTTTWDEPELIIEATKAGDHRRYGIAVASNGHLFLARDPLPANLITDYATGATLDASRASQFPSVSAPADQSANGHTICDTGTCEGIWSGNGPDGILAPFAGQLSCAAAGDFVLAPASPNAANIVLSFRKGSGPCDPAESSHRPVNAGDEIGPADYWFIRAYRDSGESVGIGIDAAGNLYVDVPPPASLCPCRAQN